MKNAINTQSEVWKAQSGIPEHILDRHNKLNEDLRTSGCEDVFKREKPPKNIMAESFKKVLEEKGLSK